MKNQVLLLICALTLVAFSCKKPDETAPDVSPNGEYFNCKIDGKYWTFKQCMLCNDQLVARFELVDYPHFSIEASNGDYPPTKFSFLIDTSEMNHQDTIKLLSYSESHVTIYSPYPLEIGVNSEFNTDSTTNGKLIFTNRTAASLQGIFEFNASNGTTVCHITEGKFLIKL